MSMNLVTLLYLIASVCFIQALKGLSHPTTSIRGNLFGMVGMAIAVVATIMGPRVTPAGVAWIIGALVVGGAIGLVQDGDIIRLDATAGTLSVLAADFETRAPVTADLSANRFGTSPASALSSCKRGWSFRRSFNSSKTFRPRARSMTTSSPSRQ